MAPLGLIAGEGVFPLLVARGARGRPGRRVVCIGLAGNADAGLPRPSATPSTGSASAGWAGGSTASAPAGANEAIMVGRVQQGEDVPPRVAILRHLPDVRTARLSTSPGCGTTSGPSPILHAVIDELARPRASRLIDSTTYCADQLATPGVMTRRQPTDDQSGTT